MCCGQAASLTAHWFTQDELDEQDSRGGGKLILYM